MSVLHTSLLAFSVVFLTTAVAQAAPAPEAPTTLLGPKVYPGEPTLPVDIKQIISDLREAENVCLKTYNGVIDKESKYTKAFPGFWTEPPRPSRVYPRKSTAFKELEALRFNLLDYQASMSQLSSFFHNNNTEIWTLLTNYLNEHPGEPLTKALGYKISEKIKVMRGGCAGIGNGFDDKFKLRYKSLQCIQLGQSYCNSF